MAGERDGAFLLAKLDVDANAVGNALLQAVRSQGIPTVVAFRDGEPVNMFIGAYPEEEVNRFVDELVPSPAELEAERRIRPRRPSGTSTRQRPATGRRSRASPATVTPRSGLARILLGVESERTRASLVEPLLPDADAEHILAQVRVARLGCISRPRRRSTRRRWLAAQGATP